IPSEQQSPLSKYIFANITLPTFTDRNPLLQSNWFGPGKSNTNQETITFRFDHSFTDHDKFYARYTQGNQSRAAYSSGTVPMLDGMANHTVRPETSHSLALNWVKTLSPSLVNELLVTGSREYADILSGDPSVFYADQLGTPNPLRVTGFPVLGGFGIGAGNY